jgi:hypothetical protein
MRTRIMSAAVLSLAFLLGPSAGGPQASARSGTSTCALVSTDDAAEVLGTSVQDVRHESAIAGSCSWRSVDPNCFMRILSIERTGVARSGSEQWLASDLPAGSIFSNDVYPAGSSLAIEFLDVPVGHAWLHFSLLGRVDRIAAQEMLSGLATTILRRGAA